jgi:uncharacterized membrane protein
MERKKMSVQKKISNDDIISILLLIVGIIAGFNKCITLTILCFLGVAVLYCIKNADKIKNAKFSKDGFEFEFRRIMKEAEVTIAEMQELAKLVSKTALSSMKRMPIYGGYSIAQEETIKESFLKMLSKIKLSSKDIEYVLEEYNKYIEMDYVHLLLIVNTSGLMQDEHNELIQMEACSEDNYPSPEEIETYLEKHNFVDKLRKELLEDYKYFRANKKYRRPKVIANYDKLANKLRSQ